MNSQPGELPAWLDTWAVDGKVVFRQKRGRLVGAVLFLGAFAFAMGAGLLQHVRQEGGWSADAGSIFALGAFSLFAWVSLLGLLSLLRPGELTIDERGVRSTIRPGLEVPWSAILDVGIWVGNGGRQVTLHLDPVWAEHARETGHLGAFYAFNRLFTGSKAYLSPLVDADAVDLMTFLKVLVDRRSGGRSALEQMFDTHGSVSVKQRARFGVSAIVVGALGVFIGATGVQKRFAQSDFAERPTAAALAALLVVACGLVVVWGLRRTIVGTPVVVDSLGVRSSGRPGFDVAWPDLRGVQVDPTSSREPLLVLDLGTRAVALRRLPEGPWALAGLLEREVARRQVGGRRR